MSRSLCLPIRILGLYIEALMGSRHIECPDGLNNTLSLSRLHPWNGSYCGNSGQNIYSKNGREVKEPPVSGLSESSLRVIQGSCHQDDLLHQELYIYIWFGRARGLWRWKYWELVRQGQVFLSEKELVPGFRDHRNFHKVGIGSSKCWRHLDNYIGIILTCQNVT